MVTYVQDYKLLDAVVHVLLILEKKKDTNSNIIFMFVGHIELKNFNRIILEIIIICQ